jgi:hypothetical protein
MSRDKKAREDEEQYLRFFNEDVNPVLNRLKYDIMKEQPGDMIEFCLRWIERAKKTPAEGGVRRRRDSDSEGEEGSLKQSHKGSAKHSGKDSKKGEGRGGKEPKGKEEEKGGARKQE